jgi:outer membrane protein assembly factor BamB
LLLRLLPLLLTVTPAVHGGDWPQWLGPKRDGVWRESGIVEKFPEAGPKALWRVPVNAGYSGPAVAGGRLYLTDRAPGPKPQRKPGERGLLSWPGNERVLCVNTADGKTLWEHTYDCDYRIDFPGGPRATPLVSDGKLYSLGAMGDLLCLDAAKGRVLWSRNFLKDFKLDEPPTWGYAAHPLLEGNKLICLVGGEGSAVVAFDKDSGKESWRALTTREVCYAPPVMRESAGKREVVVWLSDLVAGLNPANGHTNWSLPYPVEGKPQRPEVTIAMPRVEGDKVFLSSYYQGSLMLQLGGEKPSITWNRKSTSKSRFNAGLHTVMCTPAIRDGHIYGVCGGGELRCLDAATGDRLWETNAVTPVDKGPFPHAFLVEHEGRFFIWNDQGELILAKLSPKGYEEISRARLLETSENARGREVVWSHPAFANRCIFVRNGKELLCATLAAESRI